jgi:hypothetical protein
MLTEIGYVQSIAFSSVIIAAIACVWSWVMTAMEQRQERRLTDIKHKQQIDTSLLSDGGADIDRVEEDDK